MLKAIDDEERHKRELTQARAGEGIAKAQAEQARKDEQEAAAWRQWGPLGIVGAFVAGALTAAALVVGAAK